jgi:hypothetical protein
MATKTATKTTTKKTTSKKAAVKPKPAPEVEAPAAGQEEVTFGVSHLAEMLSEGREKKVTTRELRTLIRKMARDGKGRVTREIIPGNRTRYNWSGPEDAEVQAIIKAFNDGELEADKQEKLAALKERKAAQRAEKQAAKAEEVEEDDSEEEELELDDEEEDDEA